MPVRRRRRLDGSRALASTTSSAPRGSGRKKEKLFSDRSREFFGFGDKPFQKSDPGTPEIRVIDVHARKGRDVLRFFRPAQREHFEIGRDKPGPARLVLLKK